MKKSLITLTCLLFVSFSYSQTPRELVQKFFDDYEAKGASVALDNLYGTNKWMERSADAISNVKSQMEGLNEGYVGKLHGHEIIAEKKLGDSYLLLSYMAKFDRQPIRYTFQFYKPKDTWVIYSFKFDANIDNELEEAAKIYNLHLY